MARSGFTRVGLVGMAALACAVGLSILPGCLGSTFARYTVEVEEFQSWWGLDPIDYSDPDSLIPSEVPITSQVASIADGGADGISEATLFLQIQNATSNEVKAVVYAHQTEIFDIDDLLTRGVQITRPLLVGAQSARQIDARNYPDVAMNIDTLLEFIAAGNFYLYVVGEVQPFLVRANAPAISIIVIE